MSAGGLGEALTITTADSAACAGCVYRVAVYAWKKNTAFSITASSALAHTSGQQGKAPGQKAVRAAVVLQQGVATPLKVLAGERVVYRFTLFTPGAPHQIAFTPGVQAAAAKGATAGGSSPKLQWKFADLPQEGLSINSSATAKTVEEWHDFNDNTVVVRLPGPPAGATSVQPRDVYIAVDAAGVQTPVLGTLLVTAGAPGSGSGASGAAIFFLVLTLVLLLCAAVYAGLVWRGKRDARDDLSAAKGLASAGLDRLRRGLNGTGVRARVAAGSGAPPEESYLNYAPPDASDRRPSLLPPLTASGIASGSGMRPTQRLKDEHDMEQ